MPTPQEIAQMVQAVQMSMGPAGAGLSPLARGLMQAQAPAPEQVPEAFIPDFGPLQLPELGGEDPRVAQGRALIEQSVSPRTLPEGFASIQEAMKNQRRSQLGLGLANMGSIIAAMGGNTALASQLRGDASSRDERLRQAVLDAQQRQVGLDEDERAGQQLLGKLDIELGQGATARSDKAQIVAFEGELARRNAALQHALGRAKTDAERQRIQLAINELNQKASQFRAGLAHDQAVAQRKLDQADRALDIEESGGGKQSDMDRARADAGFGGPTETPREKFARERRLIMDDPSLSVEEKRKRLADLREAFQPTKK